MTPIIEALAGAAGVLLLVGALLGLLGRRARWRAGVPEGRISYSDIGATSDDGQRSPVLVARTIALRGRPDVLVERRGALIPVEIKTGRAPTRPYEGHMLQALAYCLLVEETRGVRPPYGIVRYPGREFEVPYTADAEAWVRRVATDLIDAKAGGREVARSHENPARCGACGFRERCAQALSPRRQG